MHLFKKVSSHLKNSAILFRLLSRVYTCATGNAYLGHVCSAKSQKIGNIKERIGEKIGFKIVHQKYFDLDFVLAIL